MSDIPNLSGFDAVLPANMSAEKTVLGSILLDNACYYEAAETIEPDDFALDSHRRIFLRISELMEAQRAVDIITLAEELTRYKELESVGGAAFLASLTEGLPRRPVIEEYLRIVKDKALARRVMRIAAAAIASASDQTETALETISRMEEDLRSSRAAGASGGKEVRDLLPSWAINFEGACDAPRSGLLGLHLITPKMDTVTHGLMKGELCIIAARPGHGKTESGLQVALRNARAGKRVYVQSIEMTHPQLISRSCRMMAHIDVRDMRDPRCLRPEQRQAIRLAEEELLDLAIFIDDSYDVTCQKFHSRAVLAANRWKADLAVVDYGQLLQVPKAKNSIDEAKKQAETLRHIARDFCPVIALAQIRRAPPQDLNLYPDVEMILGSSAWEQAAQMILLLHRTREEKQYTGEDYCFLGKVRELQDLRPFGIRAEVWGEFKDRALEGERVYAPSWQDGRD
jgi:replicative DNA helicase